MVDASHGNSGKDHRRQVAVAVVVVVVAVAVGQLAGGERGLTGVMLESFLRDGRQDLVSRRGWCTGGVSPMPA